MVILQHLINEPIEVEDGQKTDIQQSTGGLAFFYHRDVEIGKSVCLYVHGQRIIGVVTASEVYMGDYRITVEFENEFEALHARNTEQLVRAERYWHEQLDSGRDLTANEALTEWIDKNGENFPR